MVATYRGASVRGEGGGPTGEARRAAWPAARRSTNGRGVRYAYSNDPMLIEACLQGDEAAWGRLVDRYGPLVYSIARRWGLPTTDAEDVLQNVFTVAFRRLNGLKNYQCLAAWLITVTRRECLHHTQRTPQHADLIDEVVDGDQHLSDQVEEQERQLLVHQALSRLDATSQALLSALFLEYPTPSYEEIARRLGRAVGSIGPARARCLKKLEAVLKAMEADPIDLAPTE